ncbi:SAM-dependent methyltransferase [Saccharothrix sp. ALI-22-I]|uniref:class I SAM-dependent methyltransferase n=1 Tax=Saccharothrix sp. ALI-22-I TaxID=1933778 RepID=UPI00097C9D01|nr:class I SAM-dependent methyltransferase [Saccharothrix sp. ALI-22-I]ONI86877.1 SAM-dependent methyltransferase [Saccharothrix sp. ALI-22-I]
MTTYVFDRAHVAEQHRCLAAAYDPLTFARLAQTGVRPGWRCLDVGAGGGSVAHWLAGRGATVLATDVQPDHVRPAPRLTVLRHDVVCDPLPESRFDLVHARLVLRHLPERDAVLRKLVAALKPGGWLQIDEFDNSYSPLLLAPDRHAAELYETFLAVKESVFEAFGVDVGWGRKVAGAMAAAGLVDVDPRVVVHPWRAGSPGVRLLAHTTYLLRDKLVAAGMTDAQLAAVREVMADERFLATSPVVYSVHGRRAA